MAWNLSRSLGPNRFPQILIADDNVSTVQRLVHTIADSQGDLECDVCLSYDRAVVKLFHFPPPYKVVISNVHLAEHNDFFLVKHNRFRQSSVPFLVTTNASETESSRQALEHGAFDFILTPLEQEPTMATIRLALWQQKLKSLITSQEKALERYRHHMADYPRDRKTDVTFQSTLSLVQKSVSSLEGTYQQIDESILLLSNFATNVEWQTRKQAFERLNALAK